MKDSKDKRQQQKQQWCQIASRWKYCAVTTSCFQRRVVVGVVAEAYLVVVVVGAVEVVVAKVVVAVVVRWFHQRVTFGELEQAVPQHLAVLVVVVATAMPVVELVVGCFGDWTGRSLKITLAVM